jgi:hypothetical protein
MKTDHAKQFNVRLTPEIKEGLDAVRARDGAPYAEQFRRGLLMFFEAKGIVIRPMTPVRAGRPTKKRGRAA